MSRQETIAQRGHKLILVWAVDSSGYSQAREFYEGLSDSDQAKVSTLFRYLADQGQIHNTTKFKKVGGHDLWALKSFQIRILGNFRPGRRFVLASGLKKKWTKQKRKDLRRAKQILDEYDRLMEVKT